MRDLLSSSVLLTLVLGSSGPAGADVVENLESEETQELIATAAKRSLERARRSLTLGPLLGAAPGIDLGDAGLDVQLCFGIGLLRYDVPPFPTPARIKAILKERVEVLVRERGEAAVARGEQPTEEQVEAWVRETWEEVKAEFLLELRPKKFEKPGFNLRAEGDYLLEANAWNLRGVIGVGVGPVYVNAGTGLQIDGGAAGLVSAGLSVPMLLTDGLNAPVVHFYLRGDFLYTDRDDLSDRVFLGAQFLLDVI